jgi:hypothetical protein
MLARGARLVSRAARAPVVGRSTLAAVRPMSALTEAGLKGSEFDSRDNYFDT